MFGNFIGEVIFISFLPQSCVMTLKSCLCVPIQMNMCRCTPMHSPRLSNYYPTYEEKSLTLTLLATTSSIQRLIWKWGTLTAHLLFSHRNFLQFPAQGCIFLLPWTQGPPVSSSTSMSLWHRKISTSHIEKYQNPPLSIRNWKREWILK